MDPRTRLKEERLGLTSTVSWRLLMDLGSFSGTLMLLLRMQKKMEDAVELPQPPHF
jgi:hypothetical protein